MNKLKDIFSNRMFDMGVKLQFQDSKSHKTFLEALQIVQCEGRSIDVKGVSSLNTKVKDGDIEYPFLEQKEFVSVIIGPSTEDVPFVLNTEFGEKTVLFKRYHATSETILETDKNEIVYIKISNINNTSEITFTYRMQPHLANTIKDIVESYTTAIILINKMFVNINYQDLNHEKEQIYNMRKSIIEMTSFYKRLYAVEQELKLSFQPAQIDDEKDFLLELEELYFQFIENKVLRLNSNLNEIEFSGVIIKSLDYELKVGNIIDLTFIRELEYTVCGQKISVHSVNLLSNSIIKDVKSDENGIIKVLYGCTDDQPLYISYTGFRTYEEAEHEMMAIMEHKEKYIQALTINEYVEKKSK